MLHFSYIFFCVRSSEMLLMWWLGLAKLESMSRNCDQQNKIIILTLHQPIVKF